MRELNNIVCFHVHSKALTNCDVLLNNRKPLGRLLRRFCSELMLLACVFNFNRKQIFVCRIRLKLYFNEVHIDDSLWLQHMLSLICLTPHELLVAEHDESFGPSTKQAAVFLLKPANFDWQI